MSNWTVYEYRDVFTDFYRACDAAMQIAIDNRLSQLEEKGNLAREPISKHLDDGIFELRAKNARFLYYFEPGKKVIVVVSFIKDQNKVDPKYIDQAKRIRSIIRAGNEVPRGIN
jgi:hypothetical protein